MTTAQGNVLRQLRTMIVTGQLRPGQQIVQEALAADLGVSRVPLREALKVLEGEGQVTYHPNRGYFVADLSVEDLVEIYRIRDLLEDEAIRSAVPLLTDEDIEHISDLQIAVDAAADTGDVSEISRRNRALHFAIFDAAGLPRLVRLVRQLWDATDAYRAVYFALPENLAAIHESHEDLVRALAARDVELAVTIARRHRHRSVATVSRSLSGSS